jgi:hypothetical protein
MGLQFKSGCILGQKTLLLFCAKAFLKSLSRFFNPYLSLSQRSSEVRFIVQIFLKTISNSHKTVSCIALGICYFQSIKAKKVIKSIFYIAYLAHYSGNLVKGLKLCFTIVEHFGPIYEISKLSKWYYDIRKSSKQHYSRSHSALILFANAGDQL